MNEALTANISSDLTGDFVPAEPCQGKARGEETAQEREIQVKTTFPTLQLC